MTKKNKIIEDIEYKEVTKEPEEKVEVPRTDALLEELKGRYKDFVIVGVTKDSSKLDINSTANSFPIMQWLLNKALFEINVYEHTAANTPKQTQQ